MSKAGVNTTPNKQDNTQFKKENRTPNTTTPKDEKRQTSSDNFTNQGGRGHHGQQQHGNQQHHNQSQNRDRSGNRNDSHQFDRNAPDVKSNDKDDKSLAESSTAPVPDKKFTGRCRLFVGNLTPDVSEDEFRKMFEPYGEVSEMYVNTSRGFGFIRLDYRQNAEAAKAALDGLVRKGRVLRVRFASHGAALKVKNLHPYVSNELLEQSFSQFGDLERCVVIVDDRGKPTGEGIVEFVRKPGANSALRRITEGVFLMGADPKPLAVEPLEQKDEEDGLPEKFLTKTDQYKKEREKEPRFAPPGTFEYEFGMRWKQIEEIEKSRIEQVKKDTEDARLKLEDEMQNALYEYQAEQIRQDLRRQQEELLRLEELRNQDRMRRQQEHEIRRQQEERERAQQEERRRADTMMLMRQHEMARGRASMDMPGMRGRDDMMMVDRYGDRMPDRMGDRMPDRMPDRMGDRMPERMGDRMPERMGDRMPERMGERMPERMGERMPDRMGDRMPDRMGPGGQPGFMWDDKQRAESSSPKPLMQGSGFGGPGAPAGSGPSSNPQNSSEVSAGQKRSRFDQGGPENSYQNQRGVLGAPPGALGGVGGPGNIGGPQGNIGGQSGGSLGSSSGAALSGSGMRGGPQGLGAGGSSSNMFQPPGNMSERMLMERRREAAREELNDMKRMRRF
ncbi:hypothetical protein BsWGS_12956 [Bradybaena similaris]